MRRAEVTGANQPLRLVTRDVPEPPPEGCLVKTTCSGICHTDIHVISNKFDMGNGNVALLSETLKSRGYEFEGLVPGHEIMGTIEAFGANADPGKHGLSIGDRVCVFPWIGCEKCSVCQSGFSNMCEDNYDLTTDIGMGPNPGGYSTHVPVPNIDYAVKIPDKIPDNIACMLPCSGVTTYCAILKTQPFIEHAITKFGKARMLCIGAGGLGLWTIQLAKAFYKDKNVKVTAADIVEEHLELAKAHGAHDTVLWQRGEDADTSANKATMNGTQKYDAIVDLVGAGSTCDVAQRCLHKGGSVIAVGLAGGSLCVPMPRLVFSSFAFEGSITGPLHDLRELVKFVEANNIGYPSQEFFTLEQCNEALDKLRSGKVKGRGVFKF